MKIHMNKYKNTKWILWRKIYVDLSQYFRLFKWTKQYTKTEVTFKQITLWNIHYCFFLWFGLCSIQFYITILKINCKSTFIRNNLTIRWSSFVIKYHVVVLISDVRERKELWIIKILYKQFIYCWNKNLIRKKILSSYWQILTLSYFISYTLILFTW